GCLRPQAPHPRKTTPNIAPVLPFGPWREDPLTEDLQEPEPCLSRRPSPAGATSDLSKTLWRNRCIGSPDLPFLCPIPAAGSSHPRRERGRRSRSSPMLPHPSIRRSAQDPCVP